jgi:hypothetical protein
MIVDEIRTYRDFLTVLPSVRKGVYLGGPITGVPTFRERFASGERFLNAYNAIVLNPAVHPVGLPYEAYFPICYAMIDACTAVCFLDGWEHSNGAKREYEYVRNHKNPFLVLYLSEILKSKN